MNEHFDKEGFELVNFLKTTPDGIALPTPKRIILIERKTPTDSQVGDISEWRKPYKI